MKLEKQQQAKDTVVVGGSRAENYKQPQKTSYKSTPKTSATLREAKERVSATVKAREEADRKARHAAQNQRTEPFTLGQLQSLWMEYSQRDEVQASPVISTIMTNCSYELKGTVIHLYLSNSLQEDQLHRLTPRFMKYLRNELSNDLIELKAELIQEDGTQQSGNKLYTDADKLDYLLEEYPLFAELKEFLGLDLG